LLAEGTTAPAELVAGVASSGGATERAIATLSSVPLADVIELAMRAAFTRTLEIRNDGSLPEEVSAAHSASVHAASSTA
jgi:pyrroline-5-carboxylate reductase